jgi:signal transduction histidine kinase
MGLSRLSDRSIRSATVVPDADAYVYAILHTTDGSVWTATGSGLWREQQGVRQRFGVAQGLPGDVITALHEDRNGTLWAATTQGIARASGNRFVPVAFTPAVSFAQVRSITTDWSGALWICDSIKGLFRSESGKLVAMTEGKYDGQPYVGYTDRTGRVWVGFWSGDLLAFDGETIRHYSAADGLPTGTVNVIYEDSRRNLWVGTGQGLAALRGDRFVHFEGQGFPHSTVVSIVEEGEGLAWFGLGAGLVRINLEEFERAAADPATQLRYHFYGTEDGLPGTLGRPGTPSATRSADGRLWFTTSVGLAVVDPARLQKRPAPGPLRIDAVTVDGRMQEPQAALRLPPRTSRIEIDYSILNLAAAPRLRSRYRLDGFETEWQDAGDARQATYTNLPPGSYSFRVVSTTSDGSWSESGAALEFSVAPAFYQTWPFYGGVVLLALTGLWSGWQLRLRSVRRQYDLVLAERARVAREIHDTLLQSLVGVALEFDDISGQLEPSSPLKTQVSRVREQVEHYIRETRQSIWDLRSPTLAATDLATALRNFGDAAVAGSQVAFHFTVDGRPRRLSDDAEEQLLRIGQEAVTNAIRHAGATLIRMELIYGDEAVRLRVFDDGKGFDVEQLVQVRGSHWGVTTMRERAQHLGADFNLASHPGAGTLVEAVVAVSSRPGHRHEARAVNHTSAVR